MKNINLVPNLLNRCIHDLINLKFIMMVAFFILAISNDSWAQKKPNFFDLKEKWEEKLKSSKNERSQRLRSNSEPEEDNDEANYQRWYHSWRYRIGQDGDMSKASIEMSKYQAGLNDENRNTGERSDCNNNSDSDSGIQWTNLGPFNSDGATKQNQGRVVSISVNPSNENDIVIGTSSGIWKYDSTTESWANTTDDEGYSIYKFTSIVRHPADPNVIYAASSVQSGNWESERFYYGMGVIISVDNGNTWNPTGLNYTPENNHLLTSTHRIAIDPNSTKALTRLYAIGDVHFLQWEGNYTAYGTWLPKYTDTNYYSGPLWYGDSKFADVAVANNGNVFFTNSFGLFKYSPITNMTTQVNLSIPAPYDSYDQQCLHLQPPSRINTNIEINKQGHIVILAAFIKSNSKIIDGVQKCILTSPKLYLYRSTDNGNTWSSPKETVGEYSTGSTIRYPEFTVSPNDSDVLYIEQSNRHLRKSINFGSTFTNMNNSQVHVDVRSIFPFSGSGHDDILFLGNDGGVAKTINGKDWESINGEGLSLTVYYGCGIDEKNDKVIYTGAQDGSINFYNNGNWFETYPGGDNGDCMINPLLRNQVYQEDQYNLYQGTVSGNNIVSNVYKYLGKNWLNPLKWNGNTNEFFIGTDTLYMGTSSNLNLTEITGSAYPNGKNISSVEVSRNNPNVVYFSTDLFVYNAGAPIDDGIFKAVRTGSTWEVSNISNNLYTAINGKHGLPVPITDIAVDPNNEERIWISLGAFDSSRKVYYSNNGGTLWTNMTSTGLPNLPCTSIVFQEMSDDRIYVGTDVGIFYKDNTINCWKKYGTNNPQSMVNDMEINNCAGKLIAVTTGRGLWEAPLIVYPAEVKITGNVTWDKTRIIANNIEIMPGSTLNILGTIINIAKDVRITVHPGARINITNSTLTNECGYTWEGIYISGNELLPQTFANQGAVIVNNSTIEHAEDACMVFGGGIVQANKGRFYNNSRSIAYHKYLTQDNNGFFQNCDFKSDSDFRFDNPLRIHFTMYAIKGMQILGCNFENTNDFPFGNNVKGIGTIDAGFTVGQLCLYGNTSGCIDYVNSSFRGLNTGIYTARGIGNQTFNVYDSDFENNVLGIITSGNNAFNIRNNRFRVGRFNVGNEVIHEGVIVNSGTLFNIDQNSFEPSFNLYSDPTTIGIRVKDSGGDNNVIYKNKFSKFSVSNSNIFYANLANGINRQDGSINSGLKYFCNTNINNKINGYDFAITDLGIAVNQGSLSYPCRNIFSLGTTTQNSDFDNSANTGHINYYHNLPTNETPINIYQVSKFKTSSTNTCPSKYVQGWGGPNSKNGGEKQEESYQSAQIQIEEINAILVNSTSSKSNKHELKNTVLELNSKISTICHDAIHNIGDDKSEIVKWYTRLNSVEGMMAVIDILVMDNDLLGFEKYSKNLVDCAKQNGAEMENVLDFIELKKIQLSAIKDKRDCLSELNSNELSQINNFVKNDGIVGDQARAILNYHGGSFFIPPVFPQHTNSEVKKDIIEDNISIFRIEMTPNPANGNVKFDLADRIGQKKILNLVIRNSIGIEVHSFKLNDLIHRYNWDSSSLKEGIYYVSIYDENYKIIESKKLVIMH